MPSREEGATHPVMQAEAPTIQGGRERGPILHKVIEEVLTGETEETMSDLVARAGVLIRALGRPVMEDPAEGLSPVELADSVVRALSLSEIAHLRRRLVPEFPVHRSAMTDDGEEAAFSIVDAIAFEPDVTPEIVIHWKSDVDPSPETLEHYRAQVGACRDMTDARTGLIVVLTPGAVFEVTRGH